MTVYVPLICVPVAVMVRVEVAVPPEVKDTVVGLKVVVKPAETLADNPTFPENPLRLLTVIVEVAVWPWERVIDVGFAETVKSGEAPTTTLNAGQELLEVQRYSSLSFAF